LRIAHSGIPTKSYSRGAGRALTLLHAVSSRTLESALKFQALAPAPGISIFWPWPQHLEVFGSDSRTNLVQKIRKKLVLYCLYNSLVPQTRSVWNQNPNFRLRLQLSRIAWARAPQAWCPVNLFLLCTARCTPEAGLLIWLFQRLEILSVFTALGFYSYSLQISTLLTRICNQTVCDLPSFRVDFSSKFLSETYSFLYGSIDTNSRPNPFCRNMLAF